MPRTRDPSRSVELRNRPNMRHKPRPFSFVVTSIAVGQWAGESNLMRPFVPMMMVSSGVSACAQRQHRGESVGANGSCADGEKRWKVYYFETTNAPFIGQGMQRTTTANRARAESLTIWMKIAKITGNALTAVSRKRGTLIISAKAISVARDVNKSAYLTRGKCRPRNGRNGQEESPPENKTTERTSML